MVDGNYPKTVNIITIQKMVLDLERIKEILQNPKKKITIQRAVKLQQRLRFHTEVHLTDADAKQPRYDFLNWVQQILPKDKFAVFSTLYHYPNPTVETVDTAYHDLERVFDSKNASASYQFTNSELREDWDRYREKRLREPDIWKTDGWKQMRLSPNSILVVDLPREQTTNRPEPYFYWLEIDNVVDYELKKNSSTEFEYLIFRESENTIAVFDTQSIQIYQLGEDKQITGLISKAEHNLGYCPARFFWTDSVNVANPDIKQNPIVKELDNLDWLLYHIVSKRHLDTYAPYPIYSAYEHDCDYRNNATGDYCEGGYLRNETSDEWLYDADGNLVPCPLCSHKHITGPGSYIEVPIPNTAEGVPNLSKPVTITPADRESLDYMVAEEERLKNNIITSVVGSGGMVSEKEAINETQVAANFESKTSVLNALKTNFENAQRFIETTICKFRYGSDFISMSLNWGSEFYIFTIEELYTKLEKAKESGASNAELGALREGIRRAEYKNDPLMYSRMSILKQVEPYPNKTEKEITELYDRGLIDRESFMIKINFDNFIDRFERENTDIVEFGKNISLEGKVKAIQDTLKQYVAEQKTLETKVE